MKKGMIIPNGVVLETHEMATVVFLTELGYDVELVPRSNIRGEHTPDIKIEGGVLGNESAEGRGERVDEEHFAEGCTAI